MTVEQGYHQRPVLSVKTPKWAAGKTRFYSGFKHKMANNTHRDVVGSLYSLTRFLPYMDLVS